MEINDERKSYRLELFLSESAEAAQLCYQSETKGGVHVLRRRPRARAEPDAVHRRSRQVDQLIVRNRGRNSPVACEFFGLFFVVFFCFSVLHQSHTFNLQWVKYVHEWKENIYLHYWVTKLNKNLLQTAEDWVIHLSKCHFYRKWTGNGIFASHSPFSPFFQGPTINLKKKKKTNLRSSGKRFSTLFTASRSV